MHIFLTLIALWVAGVTKLTLGYIFIIGLLEFLGRFAVALYLSIRKEVAKGGGPQ
jgi:hypothetical protein